MRLRLGGDKRNPNTAKRKELAAPGERGCGALRKMCPTNAAHRFFRVKVEMP